MLHKRITVEETITNGVKLISSITYFSKLKYIFVDKLFQFPNLPILKFTKFENTKITYLEKQ